MNEAAAYRARPSDAGHVSIIAGKNDEVGNLLARIRMAVDAAFVLLIVADSVEPAPRAMLLAAIGPLAVELAPRTRIAAIDVGGGASDADIAAAAHFLASAPSTTGQTLGVARDD